LKALQANFEVSISTRIKEWFPAHNYENQAVQAPRLDRRRNRVKVRLLAVTRVDKKPLGFLLASSKKPLTP
jgi:hypothetical protein